MASIPERLAPLEKRHKFVKWFAFQSLIESLTDDELETFARIGTLSNPIPTRPGPLAKLDRKTLLRLWEQSEREFSRRTPRDLEVYAKNGYWPTHGLRPRYSIQNGQWIVEWAPDTES
jgi:hypothetical protein